MKVYISVSTTQNEFLELFKRWTRTHAWAADADVAIKSAGTPPAGYKRHSFSFALGKLEAHFSIDLPMLPTPAHYPFGENIVVHATLYGRKPSGLTELHSFSHDVLNIPGKNDIQLGLDFVYSVVEAWFGPKTLVTATTYNHNEQFYSIVWPEKAKRKLEMFLSGERSKKKVKSVEGVEMKGAHVKDFGNGADPMYS